MLNIVNSIFDTIEATLTGFFSVLGEGIESVVQLFYTTGTPEVPGGFTFLGTILMIGLGIGLVWTLIRWVSGLVRNVAR